MSRTPVRRGAGGSAAAERAFRAALALHEKGLLAEAARLYRAALAKDRDHFRALYYLGAIRIRQQNPRAAVALIRKALKQNPRSAEAYNNLGIALDALQRHDAAIASYERALAIVPNHAEAYNNLGIALQALDRLVEAVASYEAALAIRPDYATAHYNLGIALQALGRLADAVEHYQRAIALRPEYAEAYDNLGSALHALGRPADAIACHEKALALKPDNAATHNNLGMALCSVGRAEEAILHHVRALIIDPARVAAYNNLGVTLEALGRWQEAADAYAKALSLRSDNAEARNNLGNALQALRRPAEAIACYETALRQHPDRADIHNNLGGALESIGRIEEARQAYERAIALAPGRPAFYRSLVDLAPVAAGDPWLPSLAALAQELAALPENERIALHFALGKALADLDEPARAFDHYLAGSALKRARLDYDEAATLRQLDFTPAAISAPLMRTKQGFGHPSPVPVFIVGMPRSGTTLIEQILASHPQVFGGGEMTEFDAAIARLRDAAGVARAYPDLVPDMVGEDLRRLGADYLDRVRRLAPQAERITDKMPANFRFVGLIHLALPNARIIHARRHPLDTCLSCFTRLFAHDQAYTYDLGELGRYYRAYAALMAHWRAVLPPGVMLEVEYEAVVADIEGQARRMVAHCGLPWDDACLAFHHNRRQVRTSASQVRRPIYRSAIGRWQPYRDRLQPLLRELGVDKGTPPGL
jgi:tetratricopeptide (TPR) repeat protein